MTIGSGKLVASFSNMLSLTSCALNASGSLGLDV